MPTANTIELSTRLHHDGRVAIEVTDSGSGMTEETRRQLFTPFFTTKPAGEGTGLGLSICSSIVQSLGGELQVESEVGRGSTFRVLLKPSEPITCTAPAATTPVAMPTGGRILIVDDDALGADALRRVLSTRHTADVALSARQALALLAEGRKYDLIVCDVVMPGVSGVELYHSLQSSYPEMQKRFMFLTAGADTIETHRLLAGTRRPVLDKPYAPPALLASVAGFLR